MPRTFGVEEELLLVRPDGRPAATGAAVVDRANAAEEGAVEAEFKGEQAEIGSDPCIDAAELRRQLVDRRLVADTAARLTGSRIAAVATSPVKVRPTASPDARYLRMIDEFGLIARLQLTCGQHVHVGVESRAEGVGVLDRIGRWLPVILALSSNSPFWQGQDTGYASFRTMLWGLWPTAGPTGPFGDPAGYDAAIAALVNTGAALDDGMVYFDARLSAKYPTVEIRVADVCTDVDDSVLIGVLCRALVDTAATAWRAGTAADPVRPELARAATWRAARFGLTGTLVDPITGAPVPAAEAVQALVRHHSAALTAVGDRELVEAAVQRLLAEGTGADHQRAAATAGLASVVQGVVQRSVT